MNLQARTAIIKLMKGIFYRNDDERAFFELQGNSYGAISEYFETIGLEVLVDENDGYAYLKNIVYEDEEEALPKLITKRELSYKVSLLCVLLRKRMVDFEMQNENHRAIITKESITDELMLFLERKFNEVKIDREIAATIKKVEELGFLKKLKSDTEAYEIRPAIKAFVDASWLGEFEQRLEEYRQIKEDGWI